ncbi:hypothetical protein AAGS61_07890 [Lysinibacillus sp. KU-BSD001]|uniref:hypothetical protein n=1 Tax=Lysinibacillus sp. KU-BSD001 TaxID=3141328 RepID=UPI0036E10E49
MKYKATTQRQWILPMAFLSLAASITSWDHTWIKWSSVTIFILIFLTAFIKYTLIIHENHIVYTIHFLGIPIYKKQVTQSDIKKITFKRANWQSKMAVIKMQSGFPIRVTLFKPESIFRDLMAFCDRNNVKYEKTKDYKIIEKMAS